MRLTDHERSTLLRAIRAADPSAEVWLHGSRVRDDALGGDIDLLVMSHRLGLGDKLSLLAELHAALGDQRIDLTIAGDDQRPFVRLARAQGVRL